MLTYSEKQILQLMARLVETSIETYPSSRSKRPKKKSRKMCIDKDETNVPVQYCLIENG